MIEFLAAYLLAVNIIALLLMWWDKSRARRGAYRIPEKTLLLWALAGGSVGACLGMWFFHHKTRHTKFRYGLPLLLLVHILIIVILSVVYSISSMKY
jgi:uncharacterized membrane protein YsdA (DUF1294 family)